MIFIGQSNIRTNRKDGDNVLRDVLKEEFVQLDIEVSDYKEAIEKTLQPLLGNRYIEPRYCEAIFKNLEKLGAYIDLGKNIALPHARAEDGVLKTGISFCRLVKKVDMIDEHHSIQILFGLAAVDNNSHLEALGQLVQILNNDVYVEILKKGSKREIIELLHQK